MGRFCADFVSFCGGPKTIPISPTIPRTARDHCPCLGHGNTNGIPKVGPDVPGGPHGVGDPSRFASHQRSADSEGPLSLPGPWQYNWRSTGRARRPRRAAWGWSIGHDSRLTNDPRTARDHCPYLGHGNTNGIPKVGPDVPGGPHGDWSVRPDSYLANDPADSEGPLSLPWPWQYNGTS